MRAFRIEGGGCKGEQLNCAANTFVGAGRRTDLRSPDRFGTSSSVSPAWASFQRVYWTIAATLAFPLLVSWVAGVGPGGRACRMAGMTASGPWVPRAAELTLNRARAARGALERAGIARERIVLQKP